MEKGQSRTNGGRLHFNRVVGEGLLGEMTFEQKKLEEMRN